jgi:hypothetical protein
MTDDSPLLTPNGDEPVRIVRGPGLEYEVIGLIHPGETLEIIELGTTALAKVGLRNQWIQVRTATGVPAFVAAWQVRQTFFVSPVTRRAQPQSVPPLSHTASGLTGVDQGVAADQIAVK